MIHDPSFISIGTNQTGIVSVTEVVTAAVFQPIFNSYDTDIKIDQLSEEVFRKALEPGIFQTPAVDLLGISEESKRQLFMFKSTDSLDDLNKAFSTGLHRVLCRFEDEKQIYFLSQSDVVRFLHHLSETSADVKQVAGKSLEHLSLTKHKNLITLSDKSTALTGFRKMILHNEMSALPVINEETGKLVATLAVEDLRGLSPNNFKNVLLPVLEFLRLSRREFHGVVTVHKHSSLHQTMVKLINNKIHRVWLVEDEKPIGVVSLTDVIQLFTIYAPQ